MPTDRVLRGEGSLTVGQRLGGKGALVPVIAAVAVVIALGAWWAPSPDRPGAWIPFLAGLAVPIWFGHRIGLWRALAQVLRGEPARAWRIEVDDLGVRHADVDGARAQSFEWFELERYSPTEIGVVLWLRLPKNGATAVLLPRTFFSAADWDPLIALVREKLPGSAKAHDEAEEAARAARRQSARRAIVLWILLVGVLAAGWWLFGRS